MKKRRSLSVEEFKDMISQYKENQRKEIRRNLPKKKKSPTNEKGVKKELPPSVKDKRNNIQQHKTKKISGATSKRDISKDIEESIIELRKGKDVRELALYLLGRKR